MGPLAASYVPTVSSRSGEHSGLDKVWGSGEFFQPMEPERLEHLKMIQGIIARMGQNSFLLKGWSVTVTAGILSAAAASKDAGFSQLALLPAVVFWGLDAFYLRQERLFRALHDDICGAFGRDPVTFYLDTSGVQSNVTSWWHTLFARTVLSLHGALVVSIIVTGVMIHRVAISRLIGVRHAIIQAIAP